METSIIYQFINNRIYEDNMITLSADISHNEIKLINEKEIVLEILDTPGAEQYKTINKIFLKNADIILLIYDLTDKRTFEKLK